MIKIIGEDKSIYRTTKNENGGVLSNYSRTDFIADLATDITAMNASGSEYLKYPAGSMVYCVENKKRYILKADCSAFSEV